MKRILINLKDYQHEILRKAAFDEKKSISDIVRRSVDQYLKSKGFGKPDEKT
jgi:hypothetical protein